MCLAGWGEVHTEGQVYRFGADTTVALPKDQVHQLFNVGDEPLQLLAVLAATPVPPSCRTARPSICPGAAESQRRRAAATASSAAASGDQRLRRAHRRPAWRR